MSKIDTYILVYNTIDHTDLVYLKNPFKSC